MPANVESLLLDTSAAIPLIVADHPSHAHVLETVAGRTLGLSGHAAFETYSVLTRLPSPVRRSPATVSRVIALDFPTPDSSHCKHICNCCGVLPISASQESRCMTP